MEDRSNEIIAAAIEVHKELGPGLLESIYVEAMVYELKLKGFKVERQVNVSIIYKGNKISGCYVLDLLVNKSIILEIKSQEKNHYIHKAQLLTYLKVTGLETGLVINFGLPTAVEGISRVVNFDLINNV